MIKPSYGDLEVRLAQANRLIHEIETRCDPAGEARQHILTRDENAMLRDALAAALRRVGDLGRQLVEAQGEAFQLTRDYSDENVCFKARTTLMDILHDQALTMQLEYADRLDLVRTVAEKVAALAAERAAREKAEARTEVCLRVNEEMTKELEAAEAKLAERHACSAQAQVECGPSEGPEEGAVTDTHSHVRPEPIEAPESREKRRRDLVREEALRLGWQALVWPGGGSSSFEAWRAAVEAYERHKSRYDYRRGGR